MIALKTCSRKKNFEYFLKQVQSLKGHKKYSRTFENEPSSLMLEFELILDNFKFKSKFDPISRRFHPRPFGHQIW